VDRSAQEPEHPGRSNCTAKQTPSTIPLLGSAWLQLLGDLLVARALLYLSKLGKSLSL